MYTAFLIRHFFINCKLILPVRLEPAPHFPLELRGTCLAKWANYPLFIIDCLRHCIFCHQSRGAIGLFGFQYITVCYIRQQCRVFQRRVVVQESYLVRSTKTVFMISDIQPFTIMPLVAISLLMTCWTVSRTHQWDLSYGECST